jgi:phosphatidylinositol-3-phosphatase
MLAGATLTPVAGEPSSGRAPSSRAAACVECGAPLTLDQRYCVVCGARRAPLPAYVAARIGRAAEPTSGGSATTSGDRDGGELAPRATLPALSPSPVAGSVLALLAFGVLVGSIAGSGSAAEPPVVVAIRHLGGGASAHRTATQPGSAISEAAASPWAAGEEATEPESEAPAGSPSAGEGTQAPPASSKQQRSPPGSGGPREGSEPSPSTPPPIKHVFVVMLADQGFSSAFGPASTAPYLAKRLVAQGELVDNYYGVSPGELANGIALISGQGPTPQTAANCPLYADISPATLGAEGQVLGSGCVYPAHTRTLPQELAKSGRAWKAYLQGMGDTAAGQPAACAHPTVGAAEPAEAPTQAQAYATWRNPLVYFHSLIDDPTCAREETGIEQLGTDLAQASTTPAFAYIVPDRCHDGSEEPTCGPEQPAGLPAAGAFLEAIVPEIERSPAYREGGLIAITFDQAPQSGPEADSSGCCMSAPYPNLEGASPGSLPAGGGKTGLLLISPYVKPGSTDATDQYNHYSLLLSIERIFGLQPLGYAAMPGLLPFDATVFNADSKPPAARVSARLLPRLPAPAR